MGRSVGWIICKSDERMNGIPKRSVCAKWFCRLEYFGAPDHANKRQWQMSSVIMKSSILFGRLKYLAKQDSCVNSLVVLVERVFDDCTNLMKTTVRAMPEYTLHDEIHLDRVVELMGRLIPKDTLERLTPLEIASLIMAAALHDIGMAPSSNELDILFKSEKSSQSEMRLEYRAFCESHPTMLSRQRCLRAEEKYAEASEIDAYFLSEFLRRNHAERGRNIVFERYANDLRYEDFDFTARLADVCYSHNQEPGALQLLPCRELVRSPGEYCSWRFVAVVLRLSDILDFDPKRTPAILFEHLGIRSPISIREWKKHRSVKAWDIQPGRIAFTAQCPDPVIEKCVRDFIGWIEVELIAAGALLLDFHDPAHQTLDRHYALRLPFKVDTRGVGPKIGPNGPLYTYIDLSFHLDRDNIVSLVMGIALYAEPVLFLRELLQNAVDTVRHRLALYKKRPELGPFEPIVKVRVFKDNGRDFIEVEDNGMGMDTDIVRNYYSRVGRSYYKSGRFLEDVAKSNIDFQPVSQFGIGILSVFMAADRLEVETLRFGGKSGPLGVNIEGEGSLFWFKPSLRTIAGTKTSVRLKIPLKKLQKKGEMLKDIKQSPTLFNTISELAPHIDFPIIVEENSITSAIQEKWEIPKRHSSDDPALFSVDIDLSKNGPAGLDGIARIFLIETEGEFKDWAYAKGAFAHSEELKDYIELKFGYIEHIHKDQSLKDDHVTEGYSSEVDCRGRWSQSGFLVPYPLFFEHNWRERRTSGPDVGFPFPVWYDLNLYGDFSFPLSADRKSVLSTQHSIAVCARIYRVFIGLLFKELGKDKVEKNQHFFLKVADDDECGEVLKEELQKYLALESV